MSDYDYWEECIEIALNDEGISATKEQIKNIGGSVEVWHENYGMSHGHDCIPDPEIARESEKVRFLKDEIKELEGHLLKYRSSVARRHRVDVNRVYLDGLGDVIISPN